MAAFAVGVLVARLVPPEVAMAVRERFGTADAAGQELR
jgi:hypothetical protein